MSVISDLIVNLKGNTGGLDAALDKSARKVGDFAAHGGKAGKGFASAMNGLPGPLGRISSMFGSIGGEASGLVGGLGLVGTGFVALAAAAVAAGAALVTFGLQRQGAIENTGRLAEELGVSYNSLVGLQHAAEQSGGSAETLDASLRHLTRTVAEAAHGHGEASKALQELGLSASDLNNLSADEQLNKIADGLKGVTNHGDQARIAFQLFGREGGSKMLPMLKDGSAGLAKMGDEAKALGLTLSKDQVESVEKSNAAWKKMGDAMNGIGNTMAVFLAPYVEKVTGFITYLFQAVNTGVQAALPYWNLFTDTVQSVGKMIGEMLQPAIDAVMSIIGSWMGQLGDAGFTFENFKKIVVGAFATIQFGAEHWRDVLSLAWDAVQLGFSRWVSNLTYAFTDTLPAVFQAFGDFAGKFFSNLGKNIGENWDEIWKYMKSGGTEGGKLVWHSLAEGWDDALKKIQDKSTAPLTDFQKNLANKIKGESDKLGKGWWDAVTNKWNEFNKNATDTIDDKAKDSSGKAGGQFGNKGVAAAEEGSQEAFKIIAGQQGDKMFNVANQNLQQAKDHNKKLDALLRKLDDAKPIKAAHIR